MNFMMVHLDEITLGERTRKNMGNMEALIASIRERGLLQPVVLNEQYELIAGGRRVEAFVRMGHQSIPAVICAGLVEVVDQLKAERDENECREEMTNSEKVALAGRI